MSFGVVSIILGVVLIAGIIFYPKPKEGEDVKNPINRAYGRGFEVLSVVLKWIVPFFLIGAGVYYFFTLSKEARENAKAKEEKKEEQRKVEEKMLARQIHFSSLVEILTPL